VADPTPTDDATRIVDQAVDLPRGRVYLFGQMLALTEQLLRRVDDPSDLLGGWPLADVAAEIREAKFELWAAAITDLELEDTEELPTLAWSTSRMGGHR
jgi:hypothetical protein